MDSTYRVKLFFNKVVIEQSIPFKPSRIQEEVKIAILYFVCIRDTQHNRQLLSVSMTLLFHEEDAILTLIHYLISNLYET